MWPLTFYITDYCSISCPFSDIKSHNQLSNEQKRAYPSKHVCLCKILHKEKDLSLDKVVMMDKFANHYKTIF